MYRRKRAKLSPEIPRKDSKMKTILILVVLAITPIIPQNASKPSNLNPAPGNCAADLRAAMGRMHEIMSHLPAAANADEDFVRLMIPHHQAALDMAKTQLLCGKDPQIRRLAQEIITDQQSEIEVMDLWLKNHAAKQNISH